MEWQEFDKIMTLIFVGFVSVMGALIVVVLATFLSAHEFSIMCVCDKIPLNCPKGCSTWSDTEMYQTGYIDGMEYMMNEVCPKGECRCERVRVTTNISSGRTITMVRRIHLLPK